MHKSRSLPGLSGLGCNFPPSGPKGKKVTLDFTTDGPVDMQKGPEAPSTKALKIAEFIKASPSWRWVSLPKEPKLEQPVDTVPKNMKWPRVAPAWLKHEKQVLRFYGYFQEHVIERWDENCRYRHVVFEYYMEDGTLAIREPAIENSGISQGQFLKRQHCPRPEGNGNLGPGDFQIGGEVEINAITFHVTGCDAFTRWFHQENGITLGDDETHPEDQFRKSYSFLKLAEKGGLPMSRSAAEAKALVSFQLGKPPADKKLIQFMQNDRKVLRFMAYWDDHTLYGNRFYFRIHYYLADNTCEINEAHARNSGRWNTPVFFKRGKLLKENRLNVYPGMLEPDPQVYMPEDLLVGQAINVWGRQVYIHDCDDFTQSFYKDYLGIDQKASQIDVTDVPLVHQTLAPPVHNGLGSDEDSLENVKKIRPEPAKQDLARLLTLSGEVLRFEARMMNGEPEDENRRFIVAYYPAENHSACFELAVRNSGHMAGKFQEKKKVKNPDTKKYFAIEDFGVGKTVTIAAQAMYMFRADEHSLQYLERNCHEFRHADPGYCAQLLLPLAQLPEVMDDGGVDPDFLKAVASDHGVYIIDHEIITLLRNFNVAQEGEAPLISVPQALSYIGVH